MQEQSCSCTTTRKHVWTWELKLHSIQTSALYTGTTAQNT